MRILWEIEDEDGAKIKAFYEERKDDPFKGTLNVLLYLTPACLHDISHGDFCLRES